MSRILVIEDDQLLNGGLCFNLQNAGYETIPVYDLKNAYPVVKSQKFDLMLLDVNLPDGNGFDFAREIQGFNQKPLIFLTAHELDEEVVEGFSLGADDYITKPFSVAEVLARIKANIRRRNQYDNAAVDMPQILISGKLVMNLSDYTLTKNGNRVELTAKEFEILKLLMQNPKKVYTKEQIYSLVWNDAYLGDENAVNVHISRLRNKIEEDTRNPRYIITVWGFGYKLGENL